MILSLVMLIAAPIPKPDVAPRPALVALQVFDALDGGRPAALELIDFEELKRLNAVRAAGCSAEVLSAQFLHFVNAPIRKHRADSSYVEKSEFTLDESTDGKTATVVLRLSGNVAGNEERSIIFRLKVDDRGWRVTDMKGWFEDFVFENCKGR
jgi:hypothetical protein